MGSSGKMENAKSTVTCFYGGNLLVVIRRLIMLLIGSFNHCIANLIFLTYNFACYTKFQWLIIRTYLGSNNYVCA